MNQKCNPGLVTFERKDIKPRYLEQATREFSYHFQTKRVYIIDIFRLIVDSKYWSKRTLKINIEDWKKSFFKSYEPLLVSEIIELVVKWFNRCKYDSDITDLRGFLVESLVMAYVRKNNKINMYGTNFGWGAEVTIHPSSGKRTVEYICTNPTPRYECKDRHTVDIGIWDGEKGKFYECKVNPARIGCPEVKYMDELSRNLSDCEISHEIFFAFANSSDNVTMRIADYDSDFRFTLIGAEELSKMLSA